MRITKKWLRQQRIQLLRQVQAIAGMNRQELEDGIRRTCSMADLPGYTDAELRAAALKWAVHDALPDSMCD